MDNSENKLPSISRLKQRAKALKKSQNITHSEALNHLSNEYGYPNWKSLSEDIAVKEKAVRYETNLQDNIFVAHDDYSSSTSTEAKKARLNPNLVAALVFNNKAELVELGYEFSIFVPTETGLRKSILDATQLVRSHFEIENFHIYSTQQQGTENKIIKTAYLISNDSILESRVSLYRPNTKSGDPRMWFSGLAAFANAGDQIAILIQNDALVLVNLSASDLTDKTSGTSEHLKKIFQKKENIFAIELLERLQTISKNPIPSERDGDTGIGFTIEKLLGIQANSSKEPDYNGIEIKSNRKQAKKTVLFAQVADWSISPCKKSSEILERYGYQRGQDFKLYCTISTKSENSQKLKFIFNENLNQLEEWFDNRELVAIWPLALLQERLIEKHSETFWIESKSTKIDGHEHFMLTKVIHTSRPLISQLAPLIASGIITMDHLIKRSSNGRVSEKGPLFKISKENLSLLFPSPKEYVL